MRLWSLHPKYLDAKGLVALWRESLLAKAVLENKTVGYKHHPQLDRFKAHAFPVVAINYYLHFVYKESVRRDYKFDLMKIDSFNFEIDKIYISEEEIQSEYKHLAKKLEVRDFCCYEKLISSVGCVELHDLFVKKKE
jgi:hypothetical protein